MPRSPLSLAALATAAVPHFSPTSVQAIAPSPDDRFESAQLTTADGRQWVVRVGLSTAFGAQMEQADGLLRLLTKRVPFSLPRIEGVATTEDGTVVAVQPLLPGNPLVWRTLQPGSAIARSVGRALAAIHDVDPRAVEEAGLPTYDADAYRARRLAALDRAAATGQVPAGLLSRWERALEEIALWKFATCTVHGPLEGSHVLVDGHEIVAVAGWEQAGVSDPAADFAALSVLADPGAFDTVLEAYAGARHDSVDIHLERRVRLAAELQRINALMDAVTREDERLVERRAAALRRLDESVRDDESLLPPAPGRRSAPAVVPQEPTPPVDPDEIEVVELEDAGSDDETVEIPVGGRMGPAAAGTEDEQQPADDPEPSSYPLEDEESESEEGDSEEGDSEEGDSEEGDSDEGDSGAADSDMHPDEHDTAK